jgi:hypothetical protein
MRWAFVICGFLIGISIALTAENVRDATGDRPTCPPAPECPKQTPDEYRAELLAAARQLGWVCGPAMEGR